MCVAGKTVYEVMHSAFEDIHPYPQSVTVLASCTDMQTKLENDATLLL